MRFFQLQDHDARAVAQLAGWVRTGFPHCPGKEVGSGPAGEGTAGGTQICGQRGQSSFERSQGHAVIGVRV